MLGPALRRAAMHQRPPRPFAVRATRTFTQKPPNNNSHAVSGSSEASEPPAPSKAAEPVKTIITTPKVEEPKTNTTNSKDSSTSKITALTVPVWRRLGPVTRFIDGYSRSQAKRPYWTQVVSALVIFFAADLSAQNISGAEYDPLRTARSLIIGAAAAIPQFKWFIFLSKNFNYKSKPLSLLAKVLFNQVTFAVAFPAYFFTGQALLAGENMQRTVERLKDTMGPVWFNSWKVWPLTTAIAITYIPLGYRALFSGVVAIGWQTYLSWMNRQAELVEEAIEAAAEGDMPRALELMPNQAAAVIA